MSLELFLGPMFAGKSSAVLGVIRRNAVIGRQTLCLTSALDTRYSSGAQITSHNKDSHPAEAVRELLPVLQTESFHRAECVIVEEAQFLPDLFDFVLAAVETHGKHVICVGLDGDSERRPFGRLLDLIPYADKVHKFTAMCGLCANGTEALFTFRKLGAPTEQVNVGGESQYEPLCRAHFLAEQKKKEFVLQRRPDAAAVKGDAALILLETCIREFGRSEGSDVFKYIMTQDGGQ